MQYPWTHLLRSKRAVTKLSLGPVALGVLVAAGVALAGLHLDRRSSAAAQPLPVTVDFGTVVQQVTPTDIGVGSSTYGANPLSSQGQATAEKQLDARYIRLPVGVRNGRVTSSAGGGPTDLDMPALVSLYRSWGYRVIAVIGGRTNDVDVQPGDATTIIQALGTTGIDYSAPNEASNQGKSIQDEITLAKMIVQEGKAIDPAFKIWGPVWSYYSRDDIKSFAQALGPDLGGLDYHHYAMGSTSLPTATAMAQTIDYQTEIGEIKADLAALGLEVPVNVDELNFSWRYDDGTPGGNNRFFTSVNTVWIASALGHILQAGGRGLPYATQNGALGMMVEAGNLNPDNRPASSPMPGYWGIAAWTGGKAWPHYKDALYKTSGGDQLREVYAVNNEAGGYTVVAINKSETDDSALSLTLQGIGAGSYKVWQTNGQAPYDQPAQLPATNYAAGQALSLGLPKMSLTVIVITPAAQSTKKGDLNQDGKVNITDLSILLSNWGKSGVPADLNASGKVDITDLSILLSAWML